MGEHWPFGKKVAAMFGSLAGVAVTAMIALPVGQGDILLMAPGAMVGMFAGLWLYNRTLGREKPPVAAPVCPTCGEALNPADFDSCPVCGWTTSH